MVPRLGEGARPHAGARGGALNQAPLPANGAADDIRLPVEIWFQGNHYVYERKVPAEVVKVEIDPGQNFPDVRRGNNTWMKP